MYIYSALRCSNLCSLSIRDTYNVMSRTPGETQFEQSKLFGIVYLYRSYSLLVTFLAALLLSDDKRRAAAGTYCIGGER